MMMVMMMMMMIIITTTISWSISCDEANEVRERKKIFTCIEC